MHHLEQMVPAAVTAMKNMSAMDHDGILTVHDMGEKDYLKFYKEDKYWNLELKDEFTQETRGLKECKYGTKTSLIKHMMKRSMLNNKLSKFNKIKMLIRIIKINKRSMRLLKLA
jgi:hypothetical protein